MTNEISNTDDVIDSRDVIARIEELESTKADALAEGSTGLWSDGDEAELVALQELAKEAEGYAADWHHGEALIHESYFTEYAKQTAEDCGMVQDNAQWPNNCIDWEEAARQLKQDYTEVYFDGQTYFIR